MRNIPVAAPQDEERRQQFYAQLPHVLKRVQTFSPRCADDKPTFIFDQLYGPQIDIYRVP